MEPLLLEQFFLNTITPTQRALVVAWLCNPSNDTEIKQWMALHWELVSHSEYSADIPTPHTEAVWQQIQQKIKTQAATQNPKQPLFSLYIKKWMAAAAVLLVVVTVWYYFSNPFGQMPKPIEVVQQLTDVPPPSNNLAVLTLADGSKISLDSLPNGQLAQQGGIAINKLENGQVSYNGNASGEEMFNTLSLPKGSKPYRLFLSDGTTVWLNAASSITFPIAFKAKERKVVMEGEAYFEVAKIKSAPFIVKHNSLIVNVLGTHFNVNTYADEDATKITLLEGAVMVVDGISKSSLKPGQQAVLTNETIKVATGVDTDEVMAWQKELFYFNGASIQTIMRQVEKYYDVEVAYKDDVKYLFVAKISRQVNVSEFLKILELTNLIHFKIEGRRIIVSK